MDNKLKLIKNYSKSLFNYSIQIKKSDIIYSEFRYLNDLFIKKNNLKIFFNSPIVNYKLKKKIFFKIFSFLSKYFLNFINLLINRRREIIFVDIYKEYSKLYKLNRGIIDILITTSFIMDKKLELFIVNKLLYIIKKSKNRYNITNKINNDIIGGIIITIDNKEWDYSIKNKLFKLKKYLLNNSFIYDKNKIK